MICLQEEPGVFHGADAAGAARGTLPSLWRSRAGQRLPDDDTQPKPKVLVADDDRVIADTLVMILNISGFAAQAVYDGRAAVEAVGRYKPDMLLSDVMMPGMSGVEAAVAIMEQCPTCKVVLMTAAVAAADLMLMTQGKGHRFQILTKPIPPEVMLRRLRSLAVETGGEC